MNKLMDKLDRILKNSSVGKSAIENWFPNGRFLKQFDEIAENRFITLRTAIISLIISIVPKEKKNFKNTVWNMGWDAYRKAILERLEENNV